MQVFSGSLMLLACLYIGLLLGLTEYTAFPEDPEGQINKYYQYLVHVNIMVCTVYRAA